MLKVGLAKTALVTKRKTLCTLATVNWLTVGDFCRKNPKMGAGGKNALKLSSFKLFKAELVCIKRFLQKSVLQTLLFGADLSAASSFWGTSFRCKVFGV